MKTGSWFICLLCRVKTFKNADVLKKYFAQTKIDITTGATQEYINAAEEIFK